jgi:small multidrug resistance family-3 protein
MKLLQGIHPIVFLLVATTLEVTGDALVRKAMYEYAGQTRIALLLAGAILLLGYGLSLNLAPVPFAQIVGLYIATLFVVWQIISAIIFRTRPTIPIIIGGSLIVIGGLIVTFWTRQSN